jgi:GT2 family glycosyltransferase
MPATAHFTPEHSRVTVGIVTFNSEEHIAGCVESVAANLSDAMPSVIIFDNNSTDRTLVKAIELKKRYPFPITLITEHTNLGYAYGVNRICELIKTEWICLINPDAKLLTPAFPPSKELARIVPTCGVIGGIIINPDGKPQESGGVFPTPTMAVWDWCGLRHLFPRSNWGTTLKLNLPADARPHKIDYPTGAFWMFRREVYKRVGQFDEQFFLYFEETDFCKRAKEAGWPAYIVPSIRVEHIRGASFPNPNSTGTINTPGTTNAPGDIDTSGNLITLTVPTAIDPLQIYFESMIRYLRKNFPSWRVKRSISLIQGFLKFRKWLRKDDKSYRLFESFTTGLHNADNPKIER